MRQKLPSLTAKTYIENSSFWEGILPQILQARWGFSKSSNRRGELGKTLYQKPNFWVYFFNTAKAKRIEILIIKAPLWNFWIFAGFTIRNPLYWGFSPTNLLENGISPSIEKYDQKLWCTRSFIHVFRPKLIFKLSLFKH